MGAPKRWTPEQSGTSNEWALTMSALALLVSTSSLAYTIWSNYKFRHADALQVVRTKVTTNAARFNGAINALRAVKAYGGTPSSDNLVEATKLYAEVRDVYKAYEHYFREADRDEIDTALDKVEEGGPTAPVISFADRIAAMGEAIKLIRETLRRY